MKCWKKDTDLRELSRPPRRGAWIEMFSSVMVNICHSRRPPRRGAWIEIKPSTPKYSRKTGRPPRRGAWIEISCAHCLRIY